MKRPSMWTFLGTVLGLSLLERAVSSQQAAGSVGSILNAFAGVMRWVTDPTVPGIPNLAAPTPPQQPGFGTPGSPIVPNPIATGPFGSTAPPRDYNPGSLTPGHIQTASFVGG